MESTCKQTTLYKRVLEKMLVFVERPERRHGVRPIIYTAPECYADNVNSELLN